MQFQPCKPRGPAPFQTQRTIRSKTSRLSRSSVCFRYQVILLWRKDDFKVTIHRGRVKTKRRFKLLIAKKKAPERAF